VRCALALAVLLSALTAVQSTPSATSPVLVSYVRSGGFVGTRTSVVVRRDGRVVRSGSSFRLGPRRLATLRQALVDARFRTLARVYGDPCCDKFAHVVAYGGRSVTVYDGSVAPARLRRVLGLLASLLGR
jgi:hypothetical protein